LPDSLSSPTPRPRHERRNGQSLKNNSACVVIVFFRGSSRKWIPHFGQYLFGFDLVSGICHGDRLKKND
jgi:hypothetical protein